MLPERNYRIDPHEPRHHMTYSELNPLEYAGLVKVINGVTQDSYSRILKETHLSRDACLITVGSDGKHERHAQSQTEFVLVINTHDNGSVKEKVMKTILSHPEELRPDMRPYGSIEVKIIHSDTPCSYVYNEISHIYPDRYLNSSLIGGNKQTFFKLREKVLNEMTDASDLGKRIRGKMKDQLRDYEKATDSGIFRGVINFDHVHGIQYYSEVPPLQTGFKSAFIRGVQRKFDILTAKKIRASQLTPSDTAANLPSATIDKFEFFQQRGFIPAAMATETAEAYAWFLQQYHHIQEHYKDIHQPISLQSKPVDFIHYSQIIKKFLKTTIS